MSSKKSNAMSPPPRNFNSSAIIERDRAVSPTRAKISQLNERLSNIQLQVDDDKTIKKETFESKLKLLDEKVTKTSQTDDAKFKVLREQLVKIQDTITNEKVHRDAQDEKARTKDLKALDLCLQKELTIDRQNRKDYETRIVKQTDERAYQFRLDLARSKKAREEQEERNA